MLDDGIDLMVSCTTAVFTPGRTPLPTTPPKPFEDINGTVTPLSYGEESAPAPAPTPTPVRQNRRQHNLPYGIERASAERETDKENTMAEVNHIQTLLKGSIDILDQAGKRQNSGSASTVASNDVEHQLRKEINSLSSERDELRAAAAAGRAELFKAQKALGDAMTLLGGVQGHMSRSSAPAPPARNSHRSYSQQAMGSCDKLRSISPPPRIPFASIPKKEIIIKKPRVALTRLDTNSTNNFGPRPKSVFLTAKSSYRKPFIVHHDPSANSNESVVVGNISGQHYRAGGKKPTIAPSASKGTRRPRRNTRTATPVCEY